MDKLISKWILVVLAACVSLSAGAYGDDDKKSDKKKLGIKVENKEPKKVKTSKGEDTLTFDKAQDDTLTFDDEKNTDDTLIFADDELMRGKSNREKKTEDFSLVQKGSSHPLLNASIFPNPSFGQSQIDLNPPENTTSEIIITSQNGTLIKKATVIGDSYELSNLAAGTYIITIRNGNQTVQKRLLVK